MKHLNRNAIMLVDFSEGKHVKWNSSTGNVLLKGFKLLVKFSNED